MLKFFYRLKRRGGVVLFAVIAIMTVLIAMATTAYLTARASYQTVVSNYDFSQSYLSAISISDMIIEAITQDSDGSPNNDFSGLRKAVLDLREVTPGDTAKITGYSSNVSSGGTENEILTAAANDPVEAGVFDAVKVEIKHAKVEEINDDQKKHWFTINTTVYYRGSTISVQDVIYNIAGEEPSGDNDPFSNFFTATDQTEAGSNSSSRVVLIDCKEISDDSYFQNEYTLVGDNVENEIKGSIITSGSLYLYMFKASMDLPTSSAVTKQVGNRNDWFIGGDLMLTGNANAHPLNFNGSNLYIRGDLIINCDGMPTINAKNIYVGGNIYAIGSGSGTLENVHCSGMLYFSRNEKPGDVNAKSPAEKYDRLKTLLKEQSCGAYADKYKLGTSGFETVTFKNGDKTETINKTTGGVLLSTHGVPSYNDGDDVNISLQEKGDGHYDEYVQDPMSIKDAWSKKTKNMKFDTYTTDPLALQNELDIDLGAISSIPDTSDVMSYADLEAAGGSYTESKSDTDYWSRWEDSTIEQSTAEDGFVHYKKTIHYKRKIFNELNQDTGLFDEGDEVNEFYVKVDGSTVTFKDMDGKVTILEDGKMSFESTGTGEDKVKATVEMDGDKVKVTLPYAPHGYLLGLYNPKFGGSPKYVSYEFQTKKDKTLNVILKANFYDDSVLLDDEGNPKLDAENNPIMTTPLSDVNDYSDENGFNAFSWNNGKAGRSDAIQTRVMAMPDGGDYGNIAFEVGNYKVDPDSGDVVYGKYKRNDGFTTPVYYEGDQLVIGTQNQVEAILDPVNGTADNIENNGAEWITNNFYEAEPIAKDEYKNHIMLISNKNNGLAISGDTKGHILCGYVYAPNGVMREHPGSQSCPVFGGMIVSVYDTFSSFFKYCSPDPEVIKDILASMKVEKMDSTDTTPTDGVWGIGEYKNYIA